MEIIITFIIASITGYAGFYFGKKKEKKPLSEEAKAKRRREEEEKQWQNLFSYSESIATRGYKDE